MSGGKFIKFKDAGKKGKSIEVELAQILSGAEPPLSPDRLGVLRNEVLELIEQNLLVKKLFRGPEGKIGVSGMVQKNSGYVFAC